MFISNWRGVSSSVRESSEEIPAAIKVVDGRDLRGHTSSLPIFWRQLEIFLTTFFFFFCTIEDRVGLERIVVCSKNFFFFFLGIIR